LGLKNEKYTGSGSNISQKHDHLTQEEKKSVFRDITATENEKRLAKFEAESSSV
jgi:hypothetical protein